MDSVVSESVAIVLAAVGAVIDVDARGGRVPSWVCWAALAWVDPGEISRIWATRWTWSRFLPYWWHWMLWTGGPIGGAPWLYLQEHILWLVCTMLLSGRWLVLSVDLVSASDGATSKSKVVLGRTASARIDWCQRRGAGWAGKALAIGAAGWPVSHAQVPRSERRRRFDAIMRICRALRV